MVKCAFSGCDNMFSPNVTKKQKYCSSECSVRANNMRNVERHKRRKEVLRQPKRKCKTIGCPTLLRKTNFSDYCDACERKEKDEKVKAFREAILNG